MIAWLLACAGPGALPERPATPAVEACEVGKSPPQVAGTLVVQAWSGPGVSEGAVLRQVSWLADAWSSFGL